MTGIRWRDSVVSTQDEAHQLGAEGAPHGTTIAARVQILGRGTRGRPWVSGEGGLWLSVICRPEGKGPVEVISLRVGLALAGHLEGLLPPEHRIRIKWPNDLYMGEKKLGGILTEARWQGDQVGWIVVGVGLNVENETPQGFEGLATRLADYGVTLCPTDLAEPVANVVAQAAAKVAALTSEELDSFASRDWLKGRALVQPEEGIADGITNAGRLRIRKESGAVSEVVGSVQLAGS